MVLSHPYLEDYVVLPTRSGVRVEARLADMELNYKKSQDQLTLTRWCVAMWRSITGSQQA